MAKGFINVSTSGSGDVSYYLRESECLHVQSSANLSAERAELLEQWKQLERQEKLGSKELGIRGRHDAQVRKNYTLSLPNELSAKEAATRIEAMLKETPIQDCSYSICIHRGEKDGVRNLHAHVLVNERNLKTMKKDRQMIKKAFLEKEFRPKFEQAFAAERALGKDLVSRERIEPALFQSSPEVARELLRTYQEQARPVQKEPSLAELFSAYAAASEAKQAEKLKDLAKGYDQATNEKETKQAGRPEQQEKPRIQPKRKGLGL